MSSKSSFSPTVFGTELAKILNALLAVQALDTASFGSAPVPLLGLFTEPTGFSWYEADMLTRHYHALNISVQLALANNLVPGMVEIFAEKRDPDGNVTRPALTLLAVRQMLHKHWVLNGSQSLGASSAGAR